MILPSELILLTGALWNDVQFQTFLVHWEWHVSSGATKHVSTLAPCAMAMQDLKELAG